jgi:hypothetical protein
VVHHVTASRAGLVFDEARLHWGVQTPEGVALFYKSRPRVSLELSTWTDYFTHTLLDSGAHRIQEPPSTLRISPFVAANKLSDGSARILSAHLSVECGIGTQVRLDRLPRYKIRNCPHNILA